MCPSNPPTLHDSTNIFPFCLCSFCNTVSTWSSLLWHSVSLLCHSGRGLAWRFHALFSTTPLFFLPLRMMGHHLRILSFFIFGGLCTLLTLAQINLSCSYFLLPFIFRNSLSCCPSSFVITLPPVLRCFFACLHLYFREPLLSAGHGVLPSVQDDMSHLLCRLFSPCSLHQHTEEHMGYTTSQTHV